MVLSTYLSGKSGRPAATFTDAEEIALSVADPDRFAIVFDRHFAEIHAYVARRLGQDLADDVTADTFLTAFRQRRRYDANRTDARPWLYGIATNLMRNHKRGEIRALRALERLGAATVDTDHEEAETVSARVTAQGFRGRLAAALRHLSRGDRDAFLLVALGELTYDEVALALGIAYGTVCSRLNRARRKLRAALETEGSSRDG